MTGGVYPGLEPSTPEKLKEKSPPPSYPASPMGSENGDATTGSWQRAKGILACNRHMLENQLACDIWFTVGPTQEKVGAHRYVLMSRSGVFYAKLDGPGADCSHIELQDVKPKVFWQLLRYLYYEELYPDSDTVFDLLLLAEKYDVTAVRDVCLRFLHSCLTVQTACDILETAHRYDDQDLEKESLLYIRKHGEDVLQTEGVDRLCRECLNKILGLEGLNVSETVKEEVTDRWARRQCEDKRQEPTEDNKRESLGDVLYVTRDQKASHRYVLDTVTDRQLSNEDELDSPPPLYSDLSVENGGDVGEDEVDSVSVVSASSTASKRSMRSQISRQASHMSWVDLNSVTRFREVEGVLVNDGTADAITLTVDRNIYLYGFGVYGSKKSGEASYKVDTIVTRKKKDILMESIAIRGSGVILPCMFEKPIKVEKNKPYTIEIYVHGPDSHCGTDGKQSDTDGIVSFKFSKATAVKGNRTTDQRGQIPRLYYMPY